MITDEVVMISELIREVAAIAGVSTLVLRNAVETRLTRPCHEVQHQLLRELEARLLAAA